MAKEEVKKEAVKEVPVVVPVQKDPVIVEQKRSKMLALVAAIFGVLFVISLSFNLAKWHLNDRQSMPINFRPARNFRGGPGFGGGRVDGMHGVSLDSFFNADDTVNSAQVSKYLSNLNGTNKSAFLDRLRLRIDEAVVSGQITADQAAKLKTAFGISTSSV